jgi:septum site-determining protein MinD
MGKVIVVTSGKGGVGKTTSTAALGAALARAGENVVVVDFDVGLRNLDLVMGAERRVVYDLINVVQGVVKLPQALIRDKRIETLFLLPASQTRDKDALTEEGVGAVIAELRAKFDWVICDSPAGIERGATLAMRFADAAVMRGGLGTSAATCDPVGCCHGKPGWQRLRPWRIRIPASGCGP